MVQALELSMSGLTPETRTRLDGINRLLEDIYGHPRRLSDVLRDAGMGEDEIARLRSDHLDAYLGRLLGRWRTWMAEVLPSRRDDIPSTGSGHRIVRHYGLKGPPRPTLADPSGRAPRLSSAKSSWRSLSNEYGISRERVRQLEKDALKRLRHPARRRRLERIALETAKELLSGSDPGGCN